MAHRFVRTSVSVAFSAALLFTAPAMAAPAAEAQSMIVHTTGLDLANDAGVNLLMSRVTRAANFVCGSPNSLDLEAMRERDNCRQVAMESARPQVQLAVAQVRGGTSVAANSGSSTIRLSRR